MSLIKCPECGKEISNKSDKCIFCGYPIEHENIKDLSRNCILCGKPIEAGQEVCCECKNAYDIPNYDTLQRDEYNKMVRDKENLNGLAAIIMALIIPIVGLIMGIVFMIKNNDKSKPFLAIVISIVAFFINWYFIYEHWVSWVIEHF